MNRACALTRPKVAVALHPGAAPNDPIVAAVNDLVPASTRTLDIDDAVVSGTVRVTVEHRDCRRYELIIALSDGSENLNPTANDVPDHVVFLPEGADWLRLVVAARTDPDPGRVPTLAVHLQALARRSGEIAMLAAESQLWPASSPKNDEIREDITDQCGHDFEAAVQVGARAGALLASLLGDDQRPGTTWGQSEALVVAGVLMLLGQPAASTQVLRGGGHASTPREAEEQVEEFLSRTDT